MANLLPQRIAGELQARGSSWPSIRSGAAVRSTPALAISDIAVAAAWFVAAWLVYARFGLRLAQGIYFDYYNLAFDFDPPVTLHTLALSPADPQGVKHPLMLLLRPLAWPFLAPEFAPQDPAVLVRLPFGVGSRAASSTPARATVITPAAAPRPP